MDLTMLNDLSALIWGAGLLTLLLGTGVLLSIRCRFFQFYGWRKILHRTFGSLRRKSDTARQSGGLTQLQTFSAALAAAMGTGNVIGVSAALLIGGAGAVFWMWISALLGMMLSYGENVLAVRYAYTRSDGTRIGGPMAYLSRGLRCPILAGIYALCCIAASLGMGNMTQTGAIASLAQDAFSLSPILVGAVTAVLLGMIILRGAKGVGGVLQWLMPVLAAGYMLACLVVILRNASALPGVISQILRGAFGISAIGGGVAGNALCCAIRTGLRHGVFSNEAGLGSSALVHANMDSNDGTLQGLWSMVEVALDTLVCCTLTALAILSSGAVSGSGSTSASAALTCAFSGVFGDISPQVLSIFTALFAFCTLIGWCCCGEQAVRYLFGHRGILPYRILFCLMAFTGAAVPLYTAWTLSDIANGLMALPNLLALLLLCRRIDLPDFIMKSKSSGKLCASCRKVRQKNKKVSKCC